MDVLGKLEPESDADSKVIGKVLFQTFSRLLDGDKPRTLNVKGLPVHVRQGTDTVVVVVDKNSQATVADIISITRGGIIRMATVGSKETKPPSDQEALLAAKKLSLELPSTH